jgi:hypothetical protein
MEQILNNGALLPSAMALKDSLSQKPDITPKPTKSRPNGSAHFSASLPLFSFDFVE